VKLGEANPLSFFLQELSPSGSPVNGVWKMLRAAWAVLVACREISDVPKWQGR